MLSFGTGQTSGLPLAVTANLPSNAQTLHTAPSGAATPHHITVAAAGVHSGSMHMGIYSSAGALLTTLSSPATAEHGSLTFPALLLNGGQILKVWADAPQSDTTISAVVDDQGDVAGIVSAPLCSGLVAAVQNASRFAVGAQGGTGQTTHGAADVAMPRAGILRNLWAASSATISNGCTITVSVFVNGSISAMVLTFTASDTTVGKASTVAIPVNEGDLVSFSVACSNDGAPVAGITAAMELV